MWLEYTKMQKMDNKYNKGGCMQPRVIKEGGMLLSVEELKELSGRKNKSKIKEWLRSKGIDYLDGADGLPKVSKELVENILNGNVKVLHSPLKRGNANALREHMGIK